MNSVPKNIYLIGLMGAGKSTVGKMIAKRLGKTFYDSDHEIEKPFMKWRVKKVFVKEKLL